MKTSIFIKKLLPGVSRVIISLLILGIVCTACDTKVVEPVKTLSVSESAMEFASSGGEKSFVVESNTSWSVEHDASSWLTIAPNRSADIGTVVVTTAANTSTTLRTAIITVSSTGLPNQTISVTQAGATPTLTVSAGSLSFASAAENKTFEITSNINWSVSSSESWLTVSPTTGANNSPVSVSATANTNTTQRTATITVTGTGVTVRTISVTQSGYAASPNLTVSATSLSFASTAENITFDITSNTNWTVGSSETWLTVSPSSGTNNGIVTVNATANIGATQRTATITVSGTGITPQTISVTQQGTSYSLTLSTINMHVSSLARQETFTITSNTNWTVSSNAPSWLTVAPATGANNGTVTISIATNTSTSERKAIITVSGTGVVTQTIDITQAGTSSPDLTVSTTSMNFDATSSIQTFNITSNTNWTVKSNQNWCTVLSESSSESGSNNAKINVHVTANSSTTQRTATITVSGTGVTTRTIYITQEAIPFIPSLMLSTTSMNFNATASQQSFMITSNTNWTLISNFPYWCKVFPESGSGIREITVSVTANSGSTSRSATITAYAGSLLQQIYVEQSSFNALQGIKMVSINAGTFTMGCPESEPESSDFERPQHSVTLSAFLISEKEITNEQYRLFLNATGIAFDETLVSGTSPWGMSSPGCENYPVEVTWLGAKAFCDWAGGRLPTEAEWEYACRAGTTTPFNTGNNLTTSQANYNGNYPYNGNPKGTYLARPQPVGSYAPNAWGLYDMHGNVWEWCSNGANNYTSSDVTNPHNPAGLYCMIRGGGWNDNARWCRSASRGYLEWGRGDAGFRLVIDVP